MPEVLYHYTSLETLALILSKRTIRFARLDVLDDPQECRVADFQNLAKTKFVSCWTDCEIESIPMWREYAGTDCGVRVELPVNPFARYCWDAEDIARIVGESSEDFSGNNPLFSEALVPFEDLWDSGLFIVECAGKSDILHKVKYTNDQNLLFPKTLGSFEDNALSADHGVIGLCKAKSWAYQGEWRYLFTIMPFDIKSSLLEQDKMLARLGAFVTDCGEAYIPPYYDLKIDDSAYRSMRITPSPKMSLGNQVVLDALLEKYNPDAELIPSCIEL